MWTFFNVFIQLFTILLLLLFLFLTFWFLGCDACGIFVTQLGNQRASLHWKAKS